jgi:phosphoribosylformylglycinamidine synthase
VSVRVLLLRAPGTNCDRELKYAFERAGARVDLLPLQQLLATPDPFGKYAIAGFPGGFSYGDDVASGKIFAVELQRKCLEARLAEHLARFLDRGGLSIGICNGFQLLVKAGILPGYPPATLGSQPVTLTNNRSGRFEERWVKLECLRCRAEFVPAGETIEMPSAHGEGQFIATSEAALDQVVHDRLVAFRYITKDGAHPAPYPDNPNGSALDIAGICDLRGRAVGLMPHPERHIDYFNHPTWTRSPHRGDGAGLKLFKNLVAQARAGN